MFVDRVQKRICYLSLITLKPKTISVNLFVVSLSRNMFSVPFCGILTWKCKNDSYFVAVFILNTRSTPYFFVYNDGKCIIYLSCCTLGFKYTGPYLFVDLVQERNCYFSGSTLTSKNISGTLFVFCLSLNMFFLLFSDLLTLKWINHTYLVAVCSLNTERTLYFFI